MLIYYLLAAAVGAIALLNRRKPENTSLALPESTSLAKKDTDIGGDLATIGGSAAAALGASAGEVGAIMAAAAVGYAGGKAADKLISGGDSTPLTQNAGGLAGATIMVATMLIAFGEIAGPLYGVLVAVAVIAYALCIFINDFEELQYGQAGALRDFNKHWDKTYASCFFKLRSNPNFAQYSDLQLKRTLTPFIDGFMEELNRLQFDKWLKTGKGITEAGLNSHGHLVHGRDRGKFIGDVSSQETGNALIVDENFVFNGVPMPLARHLSIFHIREVVPPSEIYTKQQTVNVIQYSSHEVKTFKAAVAGTRRNQRGDDGEGAGVGSWSTTAVMDQKVVPTVVTTLIDPKAADIYDKGRKYCNLIQYQNWMRKNPDKIPDPQQRLNVGLSKKLFEGGQGKTTGGLSFLGYEFNYADMDRDLTSL